MLCQRLGALLSTGYHMHSLTFPSHAAVLDPVTGLGVLLLPEQLMEHCPLDSRPSGVNCGLTVSFDQNEYVQVMRQLASIGWVLPKDEEGRPRWFDAGPTDCCGRIMITLLGLDATDPGRGHQELTNSCRRIQDLAAAACCGQKAISEYLAAEYLTVEDRQ